MKELKYDAIATIALEVSAGVAIRVAMMLDLQEKPNPKGVGTLVYLPADKCKTVAARPVWLVVDEAGYPLNAPAKQITPTLPWPREAPAGAWEATGLDPYVATEAFKIVYGEAP